MAKRTIDVHRLTEEEKRIGQLLWPERDYWRPQTRGDCANVPRPCPYVACRYHLYLDVSGANSIFLWHDREPWEVSPSCALDMAELGGMTLREIGALYGLTHEAIRQIEGRALERLWPKMDEDWLGEDWEPWEWGATRERAGGASPARGRRPCAASP